MLLYKHLSTKDWSKIMVAESTFISAGEILGKVFVVYWSMIIAQVIMVGVVIGIVLTFDTIKQRKIAKALQKSKEES